MTVRPPGYGWSVVATVDGFDVFDHWTQDVVTTADTRTDAWATVTALSSAATTTLAVAA